MEDNIFELLLSHALNISMVN